jgi:hypothetical protein
MTIYGECVSGAAHTPVRISRLGRDGCELTFAAHRAALGSDLVLWIGAIGPLAIIAQAVSASATARRALCLTARFAQPLEPAILAHFGAAAGSSVA